MTTYRLARFVDWLADQERQGKRLSDSTIANIVIPLRAALTSAHREGLIRNNPSLGLTMPHREAIAQEGGRRDQGVQPRAARRCLSDGARSL